MSTANVRALCEGNVYAANGIGAVLAEQGRLAEAREIFTEVCVPALSSTASCHQSL